MTSKTTHRIALVLAVALLAAAFPLAAPSVSAAEVQPASIGAANLRAVAFATATTGVAVADNGAIYRTTDGGVSWSQVRAADTHSFRGVDFWNATAGMAIDHRGRVFRTNDGGATWSSVVTNLTADNEVYHDVDAVDMYPVALVASGDSSPSDGTDIAATLYRSSTAIENYFGYFARPHKVQSGEDLNPAGRGEFRDIEVIPGSGTAWAVGIDHWTVPNAQGTEKSPVYRWTESTGTLSRVPGFGSTHFSFEGVAFSGTVNGIIVGKNLTSGARVAKYTTTSGTTWADAASGITGTWSLNAADMSTVTNGWAVGEDGGILRTVDGGVNWSATTITGGNSNPLYDVAFVPGTNTGWAVGAGGTVLRTTDGATWTKTTGSAPDTTSPSVPAGFSATAVSASSIALSWSPSTDAGSGVKHYTVYTQAGTKVADVAHPTTTYTVSGLNPATTYGYQVTATDNADNPESAKSNVASATTLSSPPPPPPPPPAPKLEPVFRFYNRTNGTHFFTDSATERVAVNAKWPHIFTDEGVAYYTNPASNTQPLYRFYNKSNGSHFYTASLDEANAILQKWPHIFSLDGQTYKVSPAPTAGSVPVYRFYNKKNGSHFYTASGDERDTVIARWSATYTYEGPAFWLGQ